MKIIALIMAGGANDNLSVLTAVRAEAAIPFAGKFRIIDFALSNCTNSQLFNVSVLTQYMPRSLNDHIGAGKPWELDRTRGGVRLVQPYLGPGIYGWQKGTADAVRRNFDFIEEQRVDTVLILGGNHIYKMDYRPLLRFHRDAGADVTVGIRSVNPFETHRFGILTTDANQRVLTFEEKPKRARDNTASMGVYVFNKDLLKEHLFANPAHLDFGRDVLPNLIKTRRVLAYKYEGYWANVGTLQAFWEANMALLSETPALDLYDPDWVIHTRSEEQPPAKIGPAAQVGGNLLSNGAIVNGAVERSVISPGVFIAEGATVVNSIIMNDCRIGPGSVIRKAILDKEVTVGKQVDIGSGNDTYIPNKNAPDKLNTGLTVIGKGARLPDGVKIGHNVVVEPKVGPGQFKKKKIPSGETIRRAID
ncbi:MAG: glucose-1-phosphate adenylyltransferase subunit GlgD [Anaerolineae bacterium]